MERGGALELFGWLKPPRQVGHSEKEKRMGKKSLLYGIIVLTFVWGVTAAHAASTNIILAAANLPAVAPGYTFVLILHNYATGPQTFTITAFFPNGTSRVRTITLAQDRFLILNPEDIPVLPGEVANLYIRWPLGTVAQPVPPGSLLLLLIGGSPTAIPNIVVGAP
jgi:hypothetical protein